MEKWFAIGKLKAKVTEGLSIVSRQKMGLYRASLLREADADIELIDPALSSSTVGEAANLIETFANFE